MDLDKLIEEVRANSIEENIVPMQEYMRNQFQFLGIKSVERRELSKEYIKSQRDNKIHWEDIFYLWSLPEREFQYIACDYIKDRKKLLEISDLENLKKLVVEKSWWDTVDNLAPLVGESILDNEKGKEIMLTWSKDDNLWVRRSAILHQLKYKEATDTKLLEGILENNLGSDEFFINKAIGWILREYSKTNPDWVRDYIGENINRLDKLSVKEGSKYC